MEPVVAVPSPTLINAVRHFRGIPMNFSIGRRDFPAPVITFSSVGLFPRTNLRSLVFRNESNASTNRIVLTMKSMKFYAARHVSIFTLVRSCLWDAILASFDLLGDSDVRDKRSSFSLFRCLEPSHFLSLYFYSVVCLRSIHFGAVVHLL